MKQLLYLLIALLSISFIACSDDDNAGGTDPIEDAKPWVGTWLSAGANVAPILTNVFQYDSVKIKISFFCTD